ncbi:hypothetical protein MMC25_006538 [Agyrium rufum]|nr:hypothetical protein [Agyrium rufum]
MTLEARYFQCTRPQQYWNCGTNAFEGCCSVDPCDKGHCPDTTVSCANCDSKTGAGTSSLDTSYDSLTSSPFSAIDPSTAYESSAYESASASYDEDSSIPTVLASSTIGSPTDGVTVTATAGTFSASSFFAGTSLEFLSTTPSSVRSAESSALFTSKFPSATSSLENLTALHDTASSSGLSSSQKNVVEGVVIGIGGAAMLLGALLLYCCRRRWLGRGRRGKKGKEGEAGQDAQGGVQAVEIRATGDRAASVAAARHEDREVEQGHSTAV